MGHCAIFDLRRAEKRFNAHFRAGLEFRHWATKYRSGEATLDLPAHLPRPIQVRTRTAHLRVPLETRGGLSSQGARMRLRVSLSTSWQNGALKGRPYFDSNGWPDSPLEQLPRCDF